MSETSQHQINTTHAPWDDVIAKCSSSFLQLCKLSRLWPAEHKAEWHTNAQSSQPLSMDQMCPELDSVPLSQWILGIFTDQ
jgi:hypothetical protein